jgi:DNA-binding NarL/FixJ family response regulator
MAKAQQKRAAASSKKVFVVEDHPVFREGLAQILHKEDGLALCGAAGTAEQALKAIPRLKPDLVLVDITLPGKSGLELIKEIRAVNRQVKLLVISMHEEALYADRVLRAGGDGYIMKQEDPEEIVHAIRDVLAGHIYVSEEVMSKVAESPRRPARPASSRLVERLTDAELEVLEGLGRGKSNAEIARQLGLSSAEVASRCAQIRRKLKLETTNALIHHAVCWVQEDAV